MVAVAGRMNRQQQDMERLGGLLKSYYREAA